MTMQTIYILTAVRTTFTKKISRKAEFKEIGYFTSYESALKGIAEAADVVQDLEEDIELDDDYTLAFILEQKPTDHLYPNGNVGRWLFNYKGELVDEEIINNYEDYNYKGRPAEKIRLKTGDFVECLNRRNNSVEIGIVLELPVTPENFEEYRRNEPFLTEGEYDDQYIVTFNDELGGGCDCTELIEPRMTVPSNIATTLKRRYTMFLSSKKK